MVILVPKGLQATLVKQNITASTLLKYEFRYQAFIQEYSNPSL